MKQWSREEWREAQGRLVLGQRRLSEEWYYEEHRELWKVRENEKEKKDEQVEKEWERTRRREGRS